MRELSSAKGWWCPDRDRPLHQQMECVEGSNQCPLALGLLVICVAASPMACRTCCRVVGEAPGITPLWASTSEALRCAARVNAELLPPLPPFATDKMSGP